MKPIEKASLTAVCLHTQTGSSVAYANGKGISRVGIDTAVGIIDGPGCSKVFVEGYRASNVGDKILPHSCCGSPGCGIHCASPVNTVGEPLVMVGDVASGHVPGGYGG
jgi:hypothetical protein